jgi:hypothetical protein
LDRLVSYGFFPFPTVGWIHLFGTVPILGAFALVLGIETNIITNIIDTLLVAAREKTLTRTAYMDAREAIRERYLSWNRPLGLLALVAIYSTVGLLILLHDGNYDKFISVDKTYTADVTYLVVLGKETALLLMILVRVVPVNDHADAITTLLNSAPWGDPGSKLDHVRLDLLFLTTTYSVKPKALSSVWSYFTTPRNGPVSFRVCGVRPDRNWFVATLIALVSTTVGSLARQLYF